MIKVTAKDSDANIEVEVTTTAGGEEIMLSAVRNAYAVLRSVVADKGGAA